MKESKLYIGESAECKVLSAKEEGRSWKEEAGSWKPEALKGHINSARGNALGLNESANPIAPRLNIVQGDEFAWGNKENVEYRMTNNECRSEEIFAPCFSLANNKQQANPALAVKSNPEKSAQFGERFRNKSGMTATMKNGKEENTQHSINNIQLKSLKNNTKYNILEQTDCFVSTNDAIYKRRETNGKKYKNSFSFLFPNGGVKVRERLIHLN